MSKRPPEGPPSGGDEGKDIHAGPLPDQAALRDLFPPVLTCLLGGRLGVAGAVARNAPYTIRRLTIAWDQLVESQPHAAFAVAVEAFAYAGNETFLPAGRAGELMAVALLGRLHPPDTTKPPVLMPDLAFAKERPVPPLLPACTMKDLKPEEHLGLASATARALMGDVSPTLAATYAWLQNSVVIYMRHHELCLVAHELVSEALFEGTDRALEFAMTLIVDAPEPFIVDVLAFEPRARQLLNDEGSLLETVWDASAAEVAPVRRTVRTMIEETRVALYPYQRAAVQWCAERELLAEVAGERAHGGILAILPGMGKTRIMLVLIAVMRRLLEENRPTLVLAPLSVFSDWPAENAKTGLNLRIRIFHGDYDGNSGSHWRDWTSPGSGVDIILSTATTFANKAVVEGTIDPGGALRRVIIDEVHKFANRKTVTYKNLRRAIAQVPNRWALSGSVFRNQRADILSELALLGIAAGEKDAFAHLYQLDYGPETADRGVRKLEIVHVPLFPLENALYKQIYDFGKKERESGLPFLTIKAMMQRLRQAVISMDLLPAEDLETMRQEALTELRAKQNLVWNLWDQVRYGMGWLEKPFTRTIVPGYVSSRVRAVVKKMDMIARDFPGEKMLVFSSYMDVFAKVIAHLRETAPDRPWRYATYHGGLSKNERAALRRSFDTDPTFRALFITYGAGAEGMNLQVATHVLEIEPVFNSAILNQAEARAWRIRLGAPRTVYVYRFVAPTTYEERMEEIRKAKAEDWADYQGKDVPDEVGEVVEMKDDPTEEQIAVVLRD
jgi:hypothetical protein